MEIRRTTKWIFYSKEDSEMKNQIKVHYQNRWLIGEPIIKWAIAACGIVLLNLKYTRNKSKVTCKNCLKVLKSKVME